MKVTKFERVEVEVEVDVSFEDALSELVDDPEHLHRVLPCLSCFKSFLERIPDATIAEMKPEHCKIIQEFLIEQAARYQEAPNAT